MLTLTVAEIYDLACFAGFTINHDKRFMPDDDEMETEISIMACPSKGLKDDDGKQTHFAHVAYFSEYPEEGGCPLGPEITPPNVKVTGGGV